MKNKKIIFIFPIIFIIIVLTIFSILGNFNRIGYLTDFKPLDDKNNTYSFRISYYNKVFRNSDIYNVYLYKEKVLKDNNFIKEIKIDKNGSPFGILITDKKINLDKIDNIQYTLKIKNIVYLYAFIIYIFLIFIFYIISIIKENKLVLAYLSLLIIIQAAIYLSLYNYFRMII